ncbi:MAG: (Fe-S)-binding protein [Terriglobia bacterium]
METGLFERLLLLLVLAASLVAFGRTVWPRLALFLRAKPDRRFSWRTWPQRFGRVFREVLLQEKVIRERPLVGLAHALVFWGFLAFALITIDHIGLGFGAEVLDRQSPAAKMYFALVAVFAVAVLVGIVGLLVRRFLARPRALGQVSLESGVIGLLIMVLMATYLAVLYFEPHTPLGHAIWWAHTLVLAAFLPLIPKSKHFHLLLAPIGIFWQSRELALTPALDYEREEFGLEKRADATRKNILDAFACVECGRCQENCPAFLTDKVLNPKMIVLDFRKHLLTRGGEEAIVGASISEEAVFQCTTCGACEFQCPVGIEHLPLIIGLRRGQVNTGTYQEPYTSKLFLNLETRRNTFGLEASLREAFLTKAALPLYDGTQEWCLWLGCVGAYDPHGQEIIQALARVLGAAGVSFGVLRKEVCTGDAARRLGNDYLFLQLAEQNIAAMKQAHVRKLVSICPHCVKTMTQDWREAGADFEVVHHSVLLEQLAPRLPTRTGNGGVAFHDPCYLARHLGEVESPRALLGQLGSELREPGRTRTSTFCCGAGGGLVFLGEEKGKRVNRERAEELVDTGADTIATACPFCPIMLRDALGPAGESAPRVRDIAELLAAALEPEKAVAREEAPAAAIKTPDLEARLLAFFSRHPGERFHALYLPKEIGLGDKVSAVVATLKKLEQAGRLRAETVGGVRYYSAPPS